MEPHISTTPFGRRSLTLAHVASQATAKARPPDKAGTNGRFSGDLHGQGQDRRFRARVGGSRRAAELPSGDHAERRRPDRLSVQPAARPARPRHGAGDVAAASGGLGRLRPLIRRDSPNGKRFARKGRGGTIEMAFGFELSPLVARAEEFEAWAEDVQAEERALRLVRERITLCRRDIAKMIATGIEEGVPTRRAGQGPSDWSEIHGLYRGILDRIPRTADAGGTRADCGRSDAAGRRNPHPVGKSRKIINFKRQ